MGTETEQARAWRRYQRTLFDGASRLYQETRPGYPGDIVDFAVATAGVGAASDVLEVGCGTGQLTDALVRHGFRLTAIDIGPSLIAAARGRFDGSAVSFQVAAFEDYAAADGSLDLIVSGTAFHWIDPEVRFTKPARLLRPGGWLALLETGERYDGAFETALRDLWIARSEGGGAWWRHANFADPGVLADTGLFETPIHKAHSQRIVRSAEAVIGVENTRATSLSWPEDVRREFSAELHHLLRATPEVELTQETSLTMARVPMLGTGERSGS
jgi:SAM-dependent methyltransferase